MSYHILSFGRCPINYPTAVMLVCTYNTFIRNTFISGFVTESCHYSFAVWYFRKIWYMAQSRITFRWQFLNNFLLHLQGSVFIAKRSWCRKWKSTFLLGNVWPQEPTIIQRGSHDEWCQRSFFAELMCAAWFTLVGRYCTQSSEDGSNEHFDHIQLYPLLNLLLLWPVLQLAVKLISVSRT